MIARYRYPLSLVLMSCLLVSGCSTAKDLGKTLGDLANVRAELINKFGEKDVNVRVNTFQNRTSLLVTYINSPLNQKTTEERGQRAQETAEIVKQHYHSIKNVGEIWVGFMRVTSRMVIFHWSEMLETRGFDNEARALREPVSAPVDPSQPSVHFIASQNQTEISSTIQLEGRPDKGVLFIPHFSVEGNVNKITPKPPKVVALDFAAYSEKPKFPSITKIVFLSSDKVVYRAKGEFSMSKISADLYSEFFYLEMPSTSFSEIASGNTIKVRLNDHEYALTESQVLKMQRMADYLR